MKSESVNRHRGGLMLKIENSDKRGAALILEIIIYLVIVALIAVAVISGVAAIRNLVFTSHAKGDIQNIQTWVEGKYTQDNVYPSYTLDGKGNGTAVAPTVGNITDAPRLTEANGVTNTAVVASTNGASASYCIKVVSLSISETNKNDFWLSSANPSRIMQLGTATHPGGATATVAPTPAQSGVTAPCPAA